MSLTTIEKLESLGFQFWKKKSSAGSNAKETKAYFIAIKSILFCFSNQTPLDKTFVHIETVSYTHLTLPTKRIV